MSCFAMQSYKKLVKKYIARKISFLFSYVAQGFFIFNLYLPESV